MTKSSQTKPIQTKPVFRVAPSPTGRLHIGHAFSALMNEAMAKEMGGRLLLRIENIDGGRSRPEFIDGILDDMDWLGISFDGAPRLQSDRHSAYEAALEMLKDRGLVYPCFCTRGDIRAAIEGAGIAPHGDLGPKYPGTCRGLSPAMQSANFAAHKPHTWRLDVEAALQSTPLDALNWQDVQEGMQTVRKAVLDDVILDRKDTCFSYHLAVVIDDADQHITHIVRGEDLKASTPIHRLLQTVLGYPAPLYFHHALVVRPDGRRFAKRMPGLTLEDLRNGGTTAADIRKFFTERRAVSTPVFQEPTEAPLPHAN